MSIVGGTYVTVRPLALGFEGSLREQIQKAVKGQGQSAGSTFSTEFADSVKSRIGQFTDGLRGLDSKLGELFFPPDAKIKSARDALDAGDLAGAQFALGFKRNAAGQLVTGRNRYVQDGLAGVEKELERLGNGGGGSFVKGFYAQLKSGFDGIKPIRISPFVIAGGDVLTAGLTRLVGVLAQVGGGAFALVAQAGSATASLLSLASAAGSAVGSLAAVPTLLGAYGLVAGTASLASRGLAEAITAAATGSKDAAKELAALPPAARAFAREVIALKPRLEDLRKVAAAGVFPGLSASLRSALPLFPAVREAVGATAAVLGQLGFEAARLIAGPLGASFKTVLSASVTVVQTLAKAFGPVVLALSTAAAAAAPLAVTMASNLVPAVTALANRFQQFAASNAFTNTLNNSYSTLVRLIGTVRNFGAALTNTFVAAYAPGQRLLVTINQLSLRMAEYTRSSAGQSAQAEFFNRSEVAARLLGSTIGNIVGALANISRAAQSAGQQLLIAFEGATQRFQTFTGSVDGQAKLKKFFDDLVPVVTEVGSLLAALSVAIISFGSLPGNAELVRQMREELLPAITQLFTTLAQSDVLEKALTLITNITLALADFAESSQTTAGILDTLNAAVTILATVLSLPGTGVLATILTYLIGIGASMRLISGLGKGLGANLAIFRPLLPDADTFLLKLLYINDAIANLGKRTKDKILVEYEVEHKIKDAGKSSSDAAKSIGSKLASGISAAVGGAIGGAIAASGIAATVAAAVFSIPVLIGVAAVAAVAGAAVLAYKFRDEIGRFFTQTIPAVAQAIGSALSAAFGSAIDFLTGTLPTFLASIPETLRNFLFSTLPGLFGQAIGMAAAGIVLAIGGVITLIVLGITQGIPAVYNAVVGIASTVVSGIAGLAISVGGAVAAVVSAIVGFFATLPGQIAAVVATIVPVVVGFLVELPSSLGAIFSSVFETVTSILSSLVVAVVGFFTRLYQEPVATVTRLAFDISGLFATIVATITGFVSQIPGIVLSFLSSAAGFALGVLTGMLGFTTSIFGGIFSAVARSLGNIAANIVTAFGSFLEGVSAGWNRVNEQTKGKLNEFVGTAAGALQAVVGFFAGLGGRILGAISNFGSILSERGSALISGLRSGVDGAVGGLLGMVGGLGGRISGALGDLGGLLRGAGSRVIQGLIDGINSRIGDIAAAIGRAAGMIRDHLPFSPAKRGPLSGGGNPYFSGQSIVELLSAGMDSKRAQVQNSISDIASVVSGLGGSAGSVQLQPSADLVTALVTAMQQVGSAGPGGRSGPLVENLTIQNTKTLQENLAEIDRLNPTIGAA